MHPAVRARLSNNFFDRILPISKFIVFGNFILLASEMFLRLIGVSKSDTYLWVSSIYSVAMIMSLSGLAGVMVSSYLKSTASVNWGGLEQVPPVPIRTFIWLSDHAFLLSVWSLVVVLIGIVLRAIFTASKYGFSLCT